MTLRFPHAGVKATETVTSPRSARLEYALLLLVQPGRAEAIFSRNVVVAGECLSGEIIVAA
jgi:hypothetical protein